MVRASESSLQRRYGPGKETLEMKSPRFSERCRQNLILRRKEQLGGRSWRDCQLYSRFYILILLAEAKFLNEM